MINRIRAFFAGSDPTAAKPSGFDDLTLAASVLLVEAARMDGAIGEAERPVIERLLAERFSLSPEETADLLGLAEVKASAANELYSFVRTVKDRYEHEQRVEMIEMLWEVVLADGVVHDFEASLMRRVTGLIYVPDRESGEARKRVEQRLCDRA